jgi:hypothetical protein
MQHMGLSIGGIVSSVVSTVGNAVSSPTGQAVMNGVQQAVGSSGSSGMDSTQGQSKEDTTKAMIENFIWSNMKSMREDAEKKLQEAMKKKG